MVMNVVKRFRVLYVAVWVLTTFFWFVSVDAKKGAVQRARYKPDIAYIKRLEKLQAYLAQHNIVVALLYDGTTKESVKRVRSVLDELALEDKRRCYRQAEVQFLALNIANIKEKEMFETQHDLRPAGAVLALFKDGKLVVQQDAYNIGLHSFIWHHLGKSITNESQCVLKKRVLQTCKERSRFKPVTYMGGNYPEYYDRTIKHKPIRWYPREPMDSFWEWSL